jgi:hypothetical protein
MEMYEGMSVPDDHLLTDHTHDGGIKDKWFHMRSRGMESIHTMTRDMNERVSSIKPMAQTRMTAMRNGMSLQMSKLQMQLRANPTKWAGIAAGAGFGLGLMGRIMRHRAAHASIPHLVVIETAC